MRYAKQGVDLLHPPPPCRDRYIRRQIPLDIPSPAMNEQTIDFEMNGSRFQTAFGFPTTAPRFGDREPPQVQQYISPLQHPITYLSQLNHRDMDSWIPWIILAVIALFILDKILLIFLLKK